MSNRNAFGLDHVKGFGNKYRDKEIWEILRLDPEHITWLIENVDWFKLDNEAYEEYRKTIDRMNR